MKNSELIQQIILKLEKEHINLYHNVSKTEIQKHISSIKDIDNLSAIELDYEMLKLFAMFKDAHTSYMVPFKPLTHKMMFLNNKFYVYDNGCLKQIESFGPITVNEFYKKITPLMNYETQEWLNHIVSTGLNNGYIFEMLNLIQDNSVILTLFDGEKLALSLCNRKTEKDNQLKKYLPYEYKILEGNVLYLRYSKCFDDKTYPFLQLVEQISEEIKEKNIKKYILDVRGNTGGNSEILNPFQKLVLSKKLRGCVLIDNGVFSSGRFAVARFKKYCNATLIGQPTGGAAKSYGYTKPLEVEGKKFTASIKLWDFSDIFGYEGAIQPDIFVKVTIKDIQNHNDKILNKAIDFINRQKTNEKMVENNIAFWFRKIKNSVAKFNGKK